MAAAKVISEFAKGNDKLIVKAGVYAGRKLDAEGVKALASIPSKEVLLSRWPDEVADHPRRGRAGGPGREARRRRDRHRPAAA